MLEMCQKFLVDHEEDITKCYNFLDNENCLPFAICRAKVTSKGGEFMQDKLMIAEWKIGGVECVLRQLQTADMFRGTPEENAFYILAEQLCDASKLINEVSKYVE